MRPSLRSAILLLDAIGFALTAFFFFTTTSVFRSDISSRYSRRLDSDLAAVDIIARGNIAGYAESFAAFAARPRSDPALLTDFGDLYEVDSSFRIVEMLKRGSSSAVFRGFDLSKGPLGRFLSEIEEGPFRFSSILRAPEDERPSFYAVAKRGDRLLVGRVVLDTLIADLAQVAYYGGTRIAIADAQGFVLMGTSSDMPNILPARGSGRAFFGGGDYLFASMDSTSLGSQIAVFEPAGDLLKILAPLQYAFWGFLLALGFLTFGKAAFTMTRIVGPIGRFSRDIGAWVPGSPEPSPAKGIRGFEEVSALYNAFAEKAAEIRRVNESLETLVTERTAALTSANVDLEASNAELGSAVDELERTRDLLVLSEKMAVIGRLVAGVAHDLNTPLAAIRSSAATIAGFLGDVLPGLPDLIRSLEREELAIFEYLVKAATATATAGASIAAGPSAASVNQMSATPTPSDTRSRRASIRETISKALAASLEEPGGIDPDLAADDLVDMGFSSIEPAMAEVLAVSPRGEAMIAAAAALSGSLRSARLAGDVAERASLIVASLKNWSFDEKSKPRLIKIEAELETILSFYGNRLTRGIAVEKEYLDPGFVFGEAERLNRVWVNLIDNALDAMGETGRLVLRVERLAEASTASPDSTSDKPVDKPGGEYVLVAISDTGPGVPAEIADRIFAPFFTTKPRGKGTGLGLDLCRRMVELHGGTIYFKSDSRGTSFFVRLKAASEAASAHIGSTSVDGREGERSRG